MAALRCGGMRGGSCKYQINSNSSSLSHQTDMENFTFKSPSNNVILALKANKYFMIIDPIIPMEDKI